MSRVWGFSLGATLFLFSFLLASGDLRSDPPPELPGFKFVGACRLSDARFTNGSFALAPFVKHGVHSMGMRRSHGGCNERLQFEGNVLTTGKESLHNFAHRPQKYKVLPVRGQVSYHVSIYNHICNKAEKSERRIQEHINCSHRNEAFHMRNLGFEEMRPLYDPNLIRDMIVDIKPEHLLFYDYKALGPLTDPFCKKPLLQGSIEMNDAAAQNYVDYWKLHHVRPWSISELWETMYMQLEKYSCLHYERLDPSEPSA